jgi:hypothetical protein
MTILHATILEDPKTKLEHPTIIFMGERYTHAVGYVSLDEALEQSVKVHDEILAMIRQQLRNWMSKQ